MAQTTTPKELALELETSPRTLRKFLRSDTSPVAPVGKGNRYALSAADVKRIRKGFEAWSAANAAAAAEVPATDASA